MKKIIIAILIVTATVMLAGCGVVEAETLSVSDVEVAPSEMSELATWFESEGKPLILQFSTTIAALITMLSPMLIALKRIKRDSNNLVKSNSLVLSENALLKAENKDYKAKITAIDKDIRVIRKSLELGLINTPALVANGYAVQIAEVMEVGRNGQNREEDIDKSQN